MIFNLADARWFLFAAVVVVLGVAMGFLQHYRLSGNMGSVFAALVSGYAFGPVAFAIVLIAASILTWLVSSAIDEIATGA